jgi:hypothetical protein
MEFTADTWIALAALIVSVGAILFSWVTSRRLNRLQVEVAEAELRRHREDEEWSRRASVRVRLQRDPDQFVIWNDGGADASNVDLQVHCLEAPNRDPVEQARRHRKLPIPRLRSGDKQGVGAFVLWDYTMTFQVVVKWTDPDGAERADEEILRT